LPWYHRAPLGLLSGTNIHVGLQARHSAPTEDMPSRPFGDLIISAVDPENWSNVREINASKVDQPGVLADIYELAQPLNIVFAEAVTVDSGSRHDARLLVEPYFRELEDDPEKVKERVERGVRDIEGKLKERKFDYTPAHRPNPDRHELVWEDEGVIEEGWVKVQGLKEAIEKQVAESGEEAKKYDLGTAVISADTERRILRYVFPRKHAVSVNVKHRDRPGVMGEIAKALPGKNLNILSSLLRRGSTSASKAEVVFVVEPTDDVESEDAVKKRVHDAFESLPDSARLRLNVDVSGPLEPDAVLYPRRPHEIAVRPSKALESEILAVKETVPRGLSPVFISRRFVDLNNKYSENIVKELRRVLTNNGCFAMEALPQPGGFGPLAPEAVKAMMWASDAAILLVTSTPEEPAPDKPEFSVNLAHEREFSVNLAHECGFMQGQGKPLLPLVQEDKRESVLRHANLQGLPLSTFSKRNALKRKKEDSLAAAVRRWLGGPRARDLNRVDLDEPA